MNISERPYFICHMMQTLDGKIASGIPNQEIIMDYFDVYTETEKQLEGKVWMFGRKTGGAFAQAEDTPLSEPATSIVYEDFVAEKGETFGVIVDTKGVLRWEKNYINLSNQNNQFHLIIIVTKQTPISYLNHLREKNISYLISGDNETGLKVAAKKLKTHFGIEKVLLEGGGSFNGSMMSEGLIDEISLLLLPRVLNRKQAPSLFDLETENVITTDFNRTELKELDRDVLWLRYKKVNA